MNCPICGRSLEPSQSTCPDCGTHTETDPTVAFIPLPDEASPAFTPEEAASLDGFDGFALVVERGPWAGMTYILGTGITTVGRHPESSIFLDDITVSRHHCRFSSDGKELVVEDSGSTNGTYVNGSRVDRTELMPGDEVLVGRFQMIVAYGDA